MLNERLVAELVRQRLGDPDASNSARYIFLIPEALKAFGRKIAANFYLRNLLRTDKSETQATIGAGGRVELTALYENFQILLEYIDCGFIYHADSAFPLQKISVQQAALPQRGEQAAFIYYYIEGKNLFVLGEHAGALSFAVSYYPKTLAQLPDSKEVEKMFIDKLVEMVVGEDAASDGEK